MGGLKPAPPEAEPIELLRDLIRTFFADYLQLVEKDAAALLDFDRAVFPEACLDGTCVVARVPVRGGREEVTVLVRIEPDMPTPARAADSMARTLRDLRLPYGEPVLSSLVSLRGDRPGVRLEIGPLPKLRNLELGQIYFSTLGLSAANAEHYLGRPEPLAWALATLMQPARRTVAEHQAICRDKIAAAAVDPRHRALLGRSVETFLTFTRQ